ncbi:MAG: T9SS type A sorting domain-containing protein [Bacteroidota bacterium]|nr:T9SS type A sorting domain-containing protein [Bacteroidota bacterium]
MPILFFIIAFVITIYHSNDRKPQQPERSAINDLNEFEATEAKEAMRWYNDQRAYPTGFIPYGWREEAIEHTSKHNLSKSNSISSVAWISVGPNNIAGRVRSIAIHPTNPNIIYCGSVSGGIWKTTDAGSTWEPLTDFAPNLVIGCITFHPTDPNIIYSGTGEGYFNVDALRGIGILKSTDAGNSWSVLKNFQKASDPYYYYFINKIVINPNNPSILYAALSAKDAGVWKSTDGGAKWTKDFAPSSSSNFCVDLVMDPNNPNTLYSAHGLYASTDGIYKTTNGGGSWRKLTTGFPLTTTKYRRISLAIAPSNNNILYACLADSNSYTHSIQKSTNSGESWFAVGTPYDYTQAVNGTHLGGQGWYNNVIAVHPSDPNIVYTGGINLFKSTNGGVNWFRISDGYGEPYVHVDQHAITFDPSNPDIMYFGGDGGIFKSTNGGGSFIDINKNFRTVQFYSGAVHPTQNIYYGGTQDNGTLKSATVPGWSIALGGDGGCTWVDYVNPSIVYTEYVNLCIQKSFDQGNTWSRIMSGIPTKGNNQFDGTSDRCAFIAPIFMDPSDPKILVAGTYRIYRTTNGGSLWTSISNDLTGDGSGSTGAYISAIAIAKTSSQTIYIGTSGSLTSPSSIWVTTNAGSGWLPITKSTLPNRYIKTIAVDPGNRDRVFVGYSGYNTNTPATPGHIFRSSNRGTSWQDISGDLPDIPANTILINPLNTNHIIIGTDLGIYEINNGGINWIQQNSGMANVSVADLDLNDYGYLFAATHGRGMFKSSRPISATNGLSIIIHQNQIMTQYADLYVTALESLSTRPSLLVTVNESTPDSVILDSISWRVFKGSYKFSSNGRYLLNVTANDSISQPINAARTFGVQLAKAGTTTIVNSLDKSAHITVPPDALDEDVYFTNTSEKISEQESQFIFKAYQFGPAREFRSALTIAFSSEDENLKQVGKTITLFKKAENVWVPIESQINTEQNLVSIQVTKLGTYAIGLKDADGLNENPTKFILNQNYPNPFNISTTIRFVVPEPGNITLKIFDLMGKEVKTLINEQKDLGEHDAVWDGRNNSGEVVATGIYFYRITVKMNDNIKYHATSKMILIK